MGTKKRYKTHTEIINDLSKVPMETLHDLIHDIRSKRYNIVEHLIYSGASKRADKLKKRLKDKKNEIKELDQTIEELEEE